MCFFGKEFVSMDNLIEMGGPFFGCLNVEHGCGVALSLVYGFGDNLGCGPV